MLDVNFRGVCNVKNLFPHWVLVIEMLLGNVNTS
jgi:hypothetical protein